LNTFEDKKSGISTDLIVSIISLISGIVLAVYTVLYKAVISLPYLGVIAILLLLAIVVVLELYAARWFLPQIYGYFRIITAYQFRDKERDVHRFSKVIEGIYCRS
jgi:hypothetical protein